MIHGYYHVGNWRTGYRNRFCTTCHTQEVAEGRRSVIVLHVFWIPVLPIGTSMRWFCRECGLEVDARRPSRPGILLSGVLLAIFMTFIGATMLANPETRPAGIGALILGPVLAGALIVAIRRAQFSEYAAATKEVMPLSGTHCPACAGPLLPSARPRCYTCKMDIITN